MANVVKKHSLFKATGRFWPASQRLRVGGLRFPTKVDGEMVGAIGVSGGPTVQSDVDCARATLALVPDAMPGGLDS